MAKSFDEVVERTTTKQTRSKAVERSLELFGKLLLRECHRMAGQSPQEDADVLGMKLPSISKLEMQWDT